MNDDTISRQAAIDVLEMALIDGWRFYYAREKMCELPSVQKNGDIDEAVEYIKNAQEYLRDIGETWCANYLSDAIELLVGERESEMTNA